MTSTPPLLHRDFLYPLNALMHVLLQEEGEVPYLHYGLFSSAGERIGAAQERSTLLLIDHLPPPPARLLEVGSGLGTTLARLLQLGYDVEGINPDERQIEASIRRYGPLPIHRSTFEGWAPERGYDTVFFQESSQYIDSGMLFARAAELTRHVVVLDEFAMEPVDFPGALHGWAAFIEAAQRNHFRLEKSDDLSGQAAPTVSYFIERIPRYRQSLVDELGLSGESIDALVESGKRYRELYARAVYGYRFAELRR